MIFSIEPVEIAPPFAVVLLFPKLCTLLPIKSPVIDLYVTLALLLEIAPPSTFFKPIALLPIKLPVIVRAFPVRSVLNAPPYVLPCSAIAELLTKSPLILLISPTLLPYNLIAPPNAVLSEAVVSARLAIKSALILYTLPLYIPKAPPLALPPTASI